MSIGEDNKSPHICPRISRILLITFVHFVCQKNVTQDTYHETISKMDEFEMNYIFNELDFILELIHANCIVRNVRHILISTAVKTLILENVYERFFIRTEKKKYS